MFSSYIQTCEQKSYLVNAHDLPEILIFSKGNRALMQLEEKKKGAQVPKI